jgi:LemA protein
MNPNAYGSSGIDPGVIALVLLGVPVLIVIIWVAATYNRLVNLRNLIADAWSNIDTELRRRYDLIPNLVETVKGYAAHERAVIEAVTQARVNAMKSTGSPEEQAGAENELVHSLKSLFAVCEGYPDLKASENFLALQHELVNTEDRIQAARRFFNGNVRDNNNLVECFPSSIIAGMFNFERKQYFEIEDAVAREVVSIKDGLGGTSPR